MIQLIVAAIACAGFYVLAKKTPDLSGWEILASIGAGVSGFGMIFLLVSLPICRSSNREQIVRFQAFKDSVQRAREDKNLTDIERANILTKICDWNEWLASEKYWNTGMWDLWHVDEVMSLEPLK